MSENRKVKLTHQILKNTLIEMLQTKHISEISITKLCEKADLNRSTFYAHFQNPVDILYEIELETYQQIELYIRSEISKYVSFDINIIFSQFLKYIKNHKEVFMVLLGENSNQAFKKKFMDLIYQTSKISYDQNQFHSKTETEYIHLYNVIGSAAVIVYWLKQDEPVSEDIVSKLLAGLSNQVFKI